MVFIPLYDTNPLHNIGRPWVAWAIIAANVFIYFFVQQGTFGGEAMQASTVTYGLVPAFLNGIAERPIELAALPDVVTLVSYGFFHADIWHLAGNMIFLWVFADNVEDALGHFRYVIFYALCTIGAGYAFVLSAPDSEAPIIGASGAVAGNIAAYVLLYPRAKVWILALGRIPLRLRVEYVLGFWIVFQFLSLFLDDGEAVAWWSHIGGLLIGAVLVLFMRQRGVPLFAAAPPEGEPAPPPAPLEPTLDPEPGRDSTDIRPQRGPWK